MRRSMMCRLGATVLLGCLLFVVVPRVAAQGPQRGPMIISPEVLPDHRVTFRIQAPKASEITLRGDWINWRHYLSDLVPLLFGPAGQNQ